MSTNLPNIRAPRRKWLRRLIAKYVRYVEVIGYLFVVLAAAGIVACWVIQVDDVVKADVNPVIKPRTEIVKDDQNDVVVVKVLVNNHRTVQANQPLVRVCRDPKWVKRFKATQQLEEAQRMLKEAENEGSETTATDAPKLPDDAPTVELAAPIAGVVDGVKDLEGKIIQKGKDIARVIDFEDLRLKVKLIGEKVPDARIGQKAHIEILPDYGSQNIFVRGEAKWSAFNQQHVQFNDLLDAEAKEAIKAKLQDKTLTLRGDVPLTFTDVLSVSVDSMIVPQSVASDAKPAAASEFLEGLNPLRGTMIEGKHTGKIELREVPDDVKEELRRRLLEKLKGRVVSTDDKPFRVADVQNVRPAIQLKIETPDPGKDEKALEEKLKNAYVAAKIERFYEGTIAIDNPPPQLIMIVRQLQLQDKPADVKTNVWVAVAKRRVAMLLFRR
jgi:biotin carboxyl carrier protein